MTINEFMENWNNILKDVSIFTVMSGSFHGECLYSDDDLCKLYDLFGLYEVEDFCIEYTDDGCGSHYFTAIFLVDEDRYISEEFDFMLEEYPADASELLGSEE